MATEAAIQVLTERVNNALDDLKEMKGHISSMNQALVLVATMQEKINHVDAKAMRLFDIHDSTQVQLSKVQAEVKHQSLMWKMLGALVIACSGVVGWGMAQYQDFTGLLMRVTVIENVMGVKK